MTENKIIEVKKKYAVRISDHVQRLIDDPVIAKQYVPDAREMITDPAENSDPIGDNAHMPVKGIVHRYKDRVLYKIAHVCAVYCRYCFRREMVGPGKEGLTPNDHESALDYIRANKNIWEVILTGGDPFSLSPRRISETMEALCAVDHVEVIRIHTRVPAADPARITPELCAALKRDKAIYIAIHINHPNEITPEVVSAIKMLRDAGCVLLSQSVLLKGVNDDADVLEALFRKLTALSVKPYYLHHPDLAPGTKHFRLSIRRGQQIMRALMHRLSGISQPHYMLDIPGGYGKVPIGPSYISEAGEGVYRVADIKGEIHEYKESHDG
jgi:lysine 2,3-aminomutase